MKVLDSKFAKSFIKFATDGAALGWHERNGGNLTYRIPQSELEDIIDDLNFDADFTPIGTDVPSLAGEYFMVTGSGKYFSNIHIDPVDTCGIVEIDARGKNYRTVWGFVNGAKPTSELPTHLMNHEVKKLATDGKNRIIYHCHPMNVIALSCVLPLTDRDFTLALWQNMTECPIVFGDGVGVIPWMVCGGRDIAVASAEKIKKYNVIVWAQHGIFCAGTNFDEVFGLAHTVEKSAEIYVKVASMTGGHKVHQVITNENLKELQSLAKSFGVKISKEFID